MSEFPIIAKLGGSDAVYEHLREASIIRTPDALRMWRARGRIPTGPMRALMGLADAKGITYTLPDFDLPQPNGAEQAEPIEPPA